MTSLDDDEFDLTDSESEDTGQGHTAASKHSDPVTAQFRFMQHMDIPFIDDCSDISKSDDDLDENMGSTDLLSNNHNDLNEIDNAVICSSHNVRDRRASSSDSDESEIEQREEVTTSEEVVTDSEEELLEQESLDAEEAAGAEGAFDVEEDAEDEFEIIDREEVLAAQREDEDEVVSTEKCTVRTERAYGDPLCAEV